jgi:hypothetical protein
LYKNLTRLFTTPCTTGRLRDLLKCPFGRTQVAAFKTKVGVNNPDQGQLRKVISLGHQLRADDDVDRLIFNPRDELGGFFRRP